MKIFEEQHYGDFLEQRKQYRAEALDSLREREGIPAPEFIDGMWQYRDEEGNPHPWATGKRKQPDAAEMDEFWSGADARTFEILPVARDGKPIEVEVKDLERDAQLVHDAGGVSFGDASEPTPDFQIANFSDETVDAAIQGYIDKHE